MSNTPLQAPFPWFGGKSRVADIVWQAFGDVQNYVEPFFGSGAVLLARPNWQGTTESINDKDGYVSNFWRAIKANPEAVATYADMPVSETDLTARHLWLVRRKESLLDALETDPDYYDAKIAGFWVYGICSWIGTGFCSGNGPWIEQGGRLIKGTAGRGINKQLPLLSTAGQGINKQLPLLGDAGQGAAILDWFNKLSERLRKTRIACGDWSRLVGATANPRLGLTGVFLDPPYSDTARAEVYATECFNVAHEVREWCAKQADPKVRVALCGYAGEHNALEALGWSVYAWKAQGGYGSGNGNGHKERIWFSPSCLPLSTAPGAQLSLFDGVRKL